MEMAERTAHAVQVSREAEVRMSAIAKLKRMVLSAALVLIMAAPIASPADAVTVTFTGAVASGQGIIGHAFVDRSATPFEAEYAFLGVQGPYTKLVTPDAFDFVNGDPDLAIGTNLPINPFGATASAPLGLESLGITGPLHLGFAGLTLDFNNPADLLFFSPTDERRFYRGGTAKVFEESAPGVFVLLAEYSDLVVQIDIDYATGAITNIATGTRVGATPDFFPEIWTGTSFDPIDVAGFTFEGVYGRFSSNTFMEFDVTAAPEPASLALFGLGLVGLGLMRRRRMA